MGKRTHRSWLSIIATISLLGALAPGATAQDKQEASEPCEAVPGDSSCEERVATYDVFERVQEAQLSPDGTEASLGGNPTEGATPSDDDAPSDSLATCYLPGVDDKCVSWGRWSRHEAPTERYTDNPISGSAVSPRGDRVYHAFNRFDRPCERVSGNCSDIIIVAYDADGTKVWATRHEGPNTDTARDIVVSPDGSRIYIVGMQDYDAEGEGSLLVAAFDANDGSEVWSSLLPPTPEEERSGLHSTGTRLTLSPDGREIYVVGRVGILRFMVGAFDSSSGTPLWEVSYDGPGNSEAEEFPTAVAVSPDGSQVYVSGFTPKVGEKRWPPGNFVTLAYNARAPQSPGESARGELLWKAEYDQGSESQPQGGLDVDPSGKLVYATGSTVQAGQRIGLILAYDALSGETVWTRVLPDNALPQDIEHGPDGRQLYVSGYVPDSSGAYATFVGSYESTTGSLTWTDTHRTEGSGEVGYALVVGRDGKSVYVTSHLWAGFQNSNHVVTAKWDAATGQRRWAAIEELVQATPVEWWSSEQIDNGGLIQSPDGKRIYVSVHVHARSVIGGDLSLGGFSAGLFAYDTSDSPSCPPLACSPSPTESPSATPTETASPTPSGNPTTPPPADPRFDAAGNIMASNLLAGDGGGITENHFFLSGCNSHDTQGIDGFVVKIPPEFGDGTAIAKVKGSSATPYDLDFAFYSECGFISRVGTIDADETAPVPRDTSFIVVNAFLGVDTDFTLTVTIPRTPTPSATPTVSPTPEPSPTGGERGTYPGQPSDPYFGPGEPIDPFGIDDPLNTFRFGTQWGPQMIEANKAWQVDAATGFNIKVAVLDTGIDLAHEDLQCPGKLEVVASSDVVGNDSLPTDPNGHGTHVGGIIGACTNNEKGIAGVSPDATIVPIRVLNASGSGTDAQLIAGIQRATEVGAHVINLSLGFGAESGTDIFNFNAIDAALSDAAAQGVVIVAAAGNEAFPLCDYPSLAEDVICVGATDSRDNKSWYSNFANKMARGGPAVVAPGGSEPIFCDIHSENILSLHPQNVDACDEGLNGYRGLNGTSMAAPHVSGVAALLYDRLGGDRSPANAQQVIDAMTSTAVDLGVSGYDPIYGSGRVDALAAVQSIPAADPDPTPTPTPTQTQTGSASPSPSESPQPDIADVSFTDNTAESGQHSDETRFEARLSDSNGGPIEGRELSFEIRGSESTRSFTATTDGDGVASVTPTLEERPGPHQLTVRFAGDEEHAGDADTRSFIVEKENSALELSVLGEDDNKTLRARLSDLDTSSEGIANRTIDFYSDGELIGSSVTDSDGVASMALPPRHRGNNRTYEAVFEGDDFYLGASDERPGKGKGKGKGGNGGGNGGGGNGGRDASTAYGGKVLLM